MLILGYCVILERRWTFVKKGVTQFQPTFISPLPPYMGSLIPSPLSLKSQPQKEKEREEKREIYHHSPLSLTHTFYTLTCISPSLVRLGSMMTDPPTGWGVCV